MAGIGKSSAVEHPGQLEAARAGLQSAQEVHHGCRGPDCRVLEERDLFRFILKAQPVFRVHEQVVGVRGPRAADLRDESTRYAGVSSRFAIRLFQPAMPQRIPAAKPGLAQDRLQVPRHGTVLAHEAEFLAERDLGGESATWRRR